MPGPWITEGDLKQRLADLVAKDVGQLPARWDSTILDSNRSAALDVAGRLLARGYTAAQVDAWDRRAEFNADIGLFWCLTKGGIPTAASDLHIAKLDRRKELDAVLVTIGGVPVEPGGGSDGYGVSGGRMSEDDYRFTMDTEF